MTRVELARFLIERSEMSAEMGRRRESFAFLALALSLAPDTSVRSAALEQSADVIERFWAARSSVPTPRLEESFGSLHPDDPWSGADELMDLPKGNDFTKMRFALSVTLLSLLLFGGSWVFFPSEWDNLIAYRSLASPLDKVESLIVSGSVSEARALLSVTPAHAEAHRHTHLSMLVGEDEGQRIALALQIPSFPGSTPVALLDAGLVLASAGDERAAISLQSAIARGLPLSRWDEVWTALESLGLDDQASLLRETYRRRTGEG